MHQQMTGEQIKLQFYQQMQAVINSKRKKDILKLMGNLNAKIGDDNTGHELIMGKEGLGEMNENGEYFRDFCTFNSLVIGGSVFPHKRIHKITWMLPDHRAENQIDHICISSTFRRSLVYVRNKRGPISD